MLKIWKFSCEIACMFVVFDFAVVCVSWPPLVDDYNNCLLVDRFCAVDDTVDISIVDCDGLYVVRDTWVCADDFVVIAAVLCVGLFVGVSDGINVGISLGNMVGTTVGEMVGTTDGNMVGSTLGNTVGVVVGCFVGKHCCHVSLVA